MSNCNSSGINWKPKENLTTYALAGAETESYFADITKDKESLKKLFDDENETTSF